MTYLTKKQIPADWCPWIEIAKDVDRILLALREARKVSEEFALTVALCLSAAKWITGDPIAIGITLLGCGLCFLDDQSTCHLCLLHEGSCARRASEGESMRLYAERVGMQMKVVKP